MLHFAKKFNTQRNIYIFIKYEEKGLLIEAKNKIKGLHLKFKR